MEPIDDAIPSEQIAFIAYNIGVYESVYQCNDTPYRRFDCKESKA
jgi:hypothetical protein